MSSRGHSRVALYEALGNAERVTRLPEADCPGGEEIFVLVGDLSDEQGCYGSGTWIRNPAGYRRSLSSRQGATYWRKRGHLNGAS